MFGRFEELPEEIQSYFAHDDLRMAVREEFLAEDAVQRAAHLLLADYFEGRP